MKGVHCSWVDMLKIRQALASGERGDQARLEQMRCVDHSTVSTWKAACDLLDAVEGKCELTHISEFQPTHAVELARAYRRRHGKKPCEWSEDVRQELADWIDRVEAEKLTVKQLREEVQRPKDMARADTCTIDDLRQAAADGLRFGTLYADPPWPYGNQATRAATDNHYPSMSVADIAALPVGDLATDRAHLFLWTTNGFLREAFGVIDAWGFSYRSLFVWCKEQTGLGNYWRVSHELLLLGVRGSLPFRDKAIKSWERADRDKHSVKPERFRRMIERAGYAPRLELFARHKAEGWAVWGNQIERTMFDETAAAAQQHREEEGEGDAEPSLFAPEEAS